MNLKTKPPTKPAPRNATPRRMNGSSATASDCPEFIVTREHFNRYFEKPIPTSTFHDLVNKGRIIPMKEMRGFYLLNASLCRLGLREVRELPKPAASPSLEDITRLAFSRIDRNLFPEPAWLLPVEAIDLRELDHARMLADQHRDEVEALDHVALKLAYFQGVLDAIALAETEAKESN
jgi:hypothetical protein